jgi:hypothetical protein
MARLLESEDLNEYHHYVCGQEPKPIIPQSILVISKVGTAKGKGVFCNPSQHSKSPRLHLPGSDQFWWSEMKRKKAFTNDKAMLVPMEELYPFVSHGTLGT